jgi:hypothetical protein
MWTLEHSSARTLVIEGWPMIADTTLVLGGPSSSDVRHLSTHTRSHALSTPEGPLALRNEPLALN